MYLRELLAQLESVPELPPSPDGPVEEGDHVVGTLSDDLRRLYAVLQLAQRQCQQQVQAALRLRAELLGKQKLTFGEQERVEKLQATLGRQELHYETVKRLFWTSVRMAFPELLDKQSVCIREDWQVCWEESPCPIELLLSSLYFR